MEEPERSILLFYYSQRFEMFIFIFIRLFLYVFILCLMEQSLKYLLLLIIILQMDDYFENSDELQAAIEAIFFTSGEPVSLPRLYEIFNIKGTKGTKNGAFKKKMIQKALYSIRDEYNEKNVHGIYLSINGDYFSFKTKSNLAPLISAFLKIKPQKFTRAQLETLSIVAYKQPVIRSEIEQIRGVDSDSILKFLLEKNLIRIAGRKEIVGKPLIYKTTNFFLEVFGLKSLDELPSIKEIEDIINKRNKDFITDKTDKDTNQHAGESASSKEDQNTLLF